MKIFYQELRAAIEANTSALHVRLWNNQITLSEKGEQIPFKTPAVFIDFPSIIWTQIGKGKQNAQLTTRIYCVYESFTTDENEEDVQVFDFFNEVYKAVQDFKPTQSGKLQRTSEQTDINHTNLYVWTMDFISTYTDINAENPRNPTSATVSTLALDTELIIDPNTVNAIRTAKDFS